MEARGEGRATFNLTVALNPTLVRNTPNLRAKRATLLGAGPGIDRALVRDAARTRNGGDAQATRLLLGNTIGGDW